MTTRNPTHAGAKRKANTDAKVVAAASGATVTSEKKKQSASAAAAVIDDQELARLTASSAELDGTDWLQAFRCPCAAPFDARPLQICLDEPIGRAFVSATMKGHVTCMSRLAALWQSKPSERTIEILKRFPKGVLSQTAVAAWIANSSTHGLSPKDFSEFDDKTQKDGYDSDCDDVMSRVPSATEGICTRCRCHGIRSKDAKYCATCWSRRRVTCHACFRCQAKVETFAAAFPVPANETTRLDAMFKHLRCMNCEPIKVSKEPTPAALTEKQDKEWAAFYNNLHCEEFKKESKRAQAKGIVCEDFKRYVSIRTRMCYATNVISDTDRQWHDDMELRCKL